MIINQKTGRIAYHALRFRERGGLVVVQYDYDGSVLDRRLGPDEIIKMPELVDSGSPKKKTA